MAEPTEKIAILLELKQQEFEKKAKSAGAAIDRLERKFTPLAAAEAKLEKQQLRFNAALEAGTIDAAQHAKGMDLVQREYEQTAERAKRLTSNVVAMNSSVAAQTGFMTRNRHIFQQGGYQVGDFAVQVQGGTSALTAFTQQGSQLLGILGPWGAIMGAVLAVGAPLAGVIWNMVGAQDDAAESSGNLTDKLKALRESIEAVRAADSLAGVNMAKEFGDMAAQAETIYAINRKIAQIRASAALDTAARGVANELGVAGVFGFTPDEVRELDQTIADISSRMDELNQPSNMTDSQFAAANRELGELTSRLSDLQDVRSNISDLGDALGLTAIEANEVVAQFAAIGQAKGPEEQAEAMATLADYINGATKNLEEATDEGKEFYDQLLEATIQALNLAKIDIAANIASGADEAARLAENLGVSLETARLIAASQAQEKSNLAAQYEQYGQGRVAGETLIRENSALYGGDGNVLPEPKVRRPRGRSGSGRKGGREQEPLFNISEEALQNLHRQVEMLGKSKGEVAALTVKHKLLDEAKKRGLDITEELTAKIDEEAGAVGKLAEEYDLARDKIAAMEKIQGEFKDSVIDAAMGGVDAMDAFTNSIKRAALEYLLFGEGMFAGGGSKSGGGFGGLLGGVFAGMFDKGGKIPSGKVGIAGENGPEFVRGPAMVTSTRATAAAMQGGGGQMDVRVYVDDDGNWKAKVEQISGGVVQNAAPGIVGQSVNASQRSFKNSKLGWSP
ncbi:hypothetical protein [Sulfitobacter sp. UBA4523]|jgi:hypothetical protein|uniref:hypothetical protein n=1 Tax=Sulfitobacter sp. UBA4523 TaxID=1947584 RepID=UPI000C4E14B3|nr:hypothetical protein [Sulfitobacter sp. UBA4523]MAX76558.1 hypothetical protein [Roseobacter sp.]HBR41773.1 hypothetical protein [Sulfitobacter pontiacus]|tara:strand:- start:12703 stop:14910 length:2208 start_codon:yes stop_codon:yes gene_type:complete